MRTERLSTAPRPAVSYAAALLPRRSRGDTAPERTLALDGVRVDRSHLAAYCRQCGFALGDALPPTYPHLLGFPLQLRLMAAPDFPLRLPGMVHLRQRIEQHRRIDVGDALALEVWAERLRAHPRGARIDLVTQLRVGGAPAWRGRGTYLCKGASAPPGPAEDPEPNEVRTGPATARWRIDAHAGRRYARVSGDVNPIHLHPAAARLFGFPGTIAHGMWTAARCVASVAARLPDSPEVDVVFRKPVRLPSTVELGTERAAGGWLLTLRTAGTDQVNLVAGVR